MKKEVTICFRTSEDLRSSLERVAREDHRSLSSAIEVILTEYLSKNPEFPHRQERRRYGRKRVSIPARIKVTDIGKRQYEATILDISLSGLRVALPKESLSEIYEGAGNPQFETSFMLPDEEEKSVRFVCKPQRVVPVNGSIHVGASFIDTEFTSYQQLQQYLM
ncbi:MAG: PilZ domain-containing protein [Syntrophorhabdales bacterium]|jgi:hypothetical protein